MKILFIAYENIKTEARTQEVFKSLQLVSKDTTFVSWSKPLETEKGKFIVLNKGKRNYFSFIVGAIKTIINKNPQIVVLHDNYTSVLLWWILKFKKQIYIIYDSSELYIDGRPKTFKTLIAWHMRYFEKKYLKYADLVLAANEDRADIMQQYFKLKNIPTVFDNIHCIDDTFDVLNCKLRYDKYFNKNCFNIVYAGGVQKRRMTFDLINAVHDLGPKYSLIILGNIGVEDKQRFDDWMKNNNLFNNVHYLGFVSRSEWKYILSNSNLSVSAFSQDTLNNKYCASGKVYESIFEHIPILTSTNPPLKKLTDKYRIGISTDDFKKGILEIEKNYTFYKENVVKYSQSIDFEGRIINLSEIIIKNIQASKKFDKNE